MEITFSNKESVTGLWNCILETDRFLIFIVDCRNFNTNIVQKVADHITLTWAADPCKSRYLLRRIYLRKENLRQDWELELEAKHILSVFSSVGYQENLEYSKHD